MQSEIVIGIPTYQRPALLRKLLASLIPELRNCPARIIVADNECGQTAPEVVASFRAEWEAIECIPVAQRGVTAVRNAIIHHAMRSPWRWLLMLDDDGVVTPGWLLAIVSCGEVHNAHLVGGPVEGLLPDDAGLLARNSIYSARLRWPTGPVPTLNTSQNLAISHRVLDLLGCPIFDPGYGRSGGEDYDLFRKTTALGGRLAWCDEAVVVEATPNERLTLASLLARYYTTGMYMAQIDRRYDGLPSATLVALKGLCGVVARGFLAGVKFEPNLVARYFLAFFHYIGRIVGLLGGRKERYVSTS